MSLKAAALRWRRLPSLLTPTAAYSHRETSPSGSVAFRHVHTSSYKYFLLSSTLYLFHLSSLLHTCVFFTFLIDPCCTHLWVRTSASLPPYSHISWALLWTHIYFILFKKKKKKKFNYQLSCILYDGIIIEIRNSSSSFFFQHLKRRFSL